MKRGNPPRCNSLVIRYDHASGRMTVEALEKSHHNPPSRKLRRGETESGLQPLDKENPRQRCQGFFRQRRIRLWRRQVSNREVLRFAHNLVHSRSACGADRFCRSAAVFRCYLFIVGHLLLCSAFDAIHFHDYSPPILSHYSIGTKFFATIEEYEDAR